MDLTNEELAIVNFISFIGFTGALMAAFLRMLFRVYQSKKYGVPIDPLLIRDLIFFGGVGTVFFLILLFRLVSVTITPVDISHNAFWVFGSSILAVGSAVYYAYYEFFKIGK